MLFNIGVTGGAGFLGEAFVMLAVFLGVCLLILCVSFSFLKDAIRAAGVPLFQACIPILGIYLVTKKTGGSFFRWLLGHVLYVVFALIVVLAYSSSKFEQFHATYGIIGLVIGYIVVLVAFLLILYMIVDSIRLDTTMLLNLGFSILHVYAFFLLCYFCIPGLRGFLSRYGITL